MPLSLQNKKIIISAGASGIGWATAKVCISRGAQVFLCDINEKLINRIKVNEDQFLEEFLSKIVCSDTIVEVIDKKGDVKGYITNKELETSLTKS